MDVIPWKMLLFVVLLSMGCWGEGLRGINDEEYILPASTEMIFDFIPNVPSKALGIFTTIMVQVERRNGSRDEFWRINTNYTTEDTRFAFRELCRTQLYTKYSEDEHDDLQWGNCTFSSGGIYAHLTQGAPTPEIWDKNITYLEIKVKPFVRRREDGGLEECVLNEISETTAYVTLLTFRFKNVDGEDDRPLFKLDRVMPEALNFLQDVIEVENIYHYRPEDFLIQNRPYKCLLDIASAATADRIEENCSFSCTKKIAPVLENQGHTEL